MALTSNRLIHEKSPYLLQHAHNPVDWFPWGDEAFAEARRRDVPLLVSIGYSTCHWCHVMERECFENADIAAVMNEHLVCIKVDREERPDIDRIYLTAVSAMTGSGGWPLNAFITPDGDPFFGGTYFPPRSRGGHPGWADVVVHLGRAWKDPAQRADVLAMGTQLTQALRASVASGGPQTQEAGRIEWLQTLERELARVFDAARGGFGPAPKFPMPVYHNFLLHYSAQNPQAGAQALTMSTTTLRAMARGGIYDHLGGGFARYSTDADWHIPHFEKMLYDNAQLAVNYLDVSLQFPDEELKRAARQTLDYLRRDMRHPEGGFYSAEDADSVGIEGAFYVWDKSEIDSHLGEAAPLFHFRYGVREGGNAAQDPHGEFRKKNILYAAHPIPEAARRFEISDSQAMDSLERSRQILLAARSSRPRPQRDDKVITAWNGLAITAFARAWQVLGDPADLADAQTAAHFLRARLYDPQSHQLFRRWREGERGIKAIADDYAFLIQGLLDLYESDFDIQWLSWAEELMETLNRDFWDSRGGYFMTAESQDKRLILRVKEEQDNVEPCAGSVSALNLLRLGWMLDKGEWHEKAQATVKAHSRVLRESPRALPQMAIALDWILHEPQQIVLAGRRDAADTKTLAQAVYRTPSRRRILLLADGAEGQSWLSRKLDFISSVKPVGGQAAAYVCKDRVCSAPVTHL